MLPNLEKIEIAFRNMSKEGFDLNSKLKWGFFFFDSSKTKLENVFNELKDSGYSEEFSKLEDGKWRLYVTKMDILTPEKLHKRNIAFNELASYCEVELYDGWDVERC